MSPRTGAAITSAFGTDSACGYETGEDQADADEEALNRAKADGYHAGLSDGENALRPFYQRHHAAYRQKTESSFRNGYIRGFNAARDRAR